MVANTAAAAPLDPAPDADAEAPDPEKSEDAPGLLKDTDPEAFVRASYDSISASTSTSSSSIKSESSGSERLLLPLELLPDFDDEPAKDGAAADAPSRPVRLALPGRPAAAEEEEKPADALDPEPESGREELDRAEDAAEEADEAAEEPDREDEAEGAADEVRELGRARELRASCRERSASSLSSGADCRDLLLLLDRSPVDDEELLLELLGFSSSPAPAAAFASRP